MLPSRGLSLRWYFAFFFVSGFCSLAYEVVWLRLAMAQFGVTSTSVATVLSVFMGGLAIGSWAGGRLSRRIDSRTDRIPLRLYALTEFLIGLSGIVVPPLLEFGRPMLNQIAVGAAWGSGAYYLTSGLWVALTMLPFTICMGATIPLAMWAIQTHRASDGRSFSFLYMSNVLGATAGTVVAAFLLIEFIGLRHTLLVAASLNFSLAALVGVLSLRSESMVELKVDDPREKPALKSDRRGGFGVSKLPTMALLLLTGLMSLGMEVVWTRQFTPYLGTVVYAFAGTLALYLGATYVGSVIYRRWISLSGTRDPHGALRVLLALIAVASLLPVVMSDPRMPIPETRVWGPVRVILGVVPFTGLVGFLSPLLVDGWSGGKPDRAGSAYAVNTVGSILGPLIAAFLLLPFMSERWVILVLLAPLLLAGLALSISGNRNQRRATGLSLGLPSAVIIVSLAIVVLSRDYHSHTRFEDPEVRRDHAATVVAATIDGRKHLLVNGVGMVYQTPITKMMAHLPLAFLEEPADTALVVAFGMGTSVRSVRSWDITTIAVELIPSVPSLFGYFYDDGPELLQSPKLEVVIDDGRRFLERRTGRYDMITVDPPPPVETAGTSMLYSKEWYSLVKSRLHPAGILQQWLPYGDLTTLTAVARALDSSFPHVRVFNSFEGWGFHFLASMSEIPDLSAQELADRLPLGARADLVESGPYATVKEQFEAVLEREVPLPVLLNADPSARTLTDDFPVNEYFLWRRITKHSWTIYFSYSPSSGRFIPDRFSTAPVEPAER